MKSQCSLYFLLLTLKIIFYKKELQRSETCDSHSGATGPIHGKCSCHCKTSTAISIFQKHLNFRAILSFKLKHGCTFQIHFIKNMLCFDIRVSNATKTRSDQRCVVFICIRFRECWEQKYSQTRLAVCNTDCYPLKVNNWKQICKATQELSCLKLTKISVRSSVCMTVSCCFCIINKTREGHDFFAVMYPLLSVFSNKIKRLKRNLLASVL